MKKFIFLTLLACVFTLQSNGSVTINRNTFPDERLREALVEEGIDADANGVLTNEEIENATYIHVVGAKNLKGLELLPNLETILLVGDEESYSCITSFDAKKFSKLSRFEIENYALTSLDLTHQPNMWWFTVKDCLDFSDIKVSSEQDNMLSGQLENLPKLTSMSNCQFVNLYGIEFFKTGIQDIDFSNNPTIEYLWIKGWEDELYELNSVNVSGCDNLWDLTLDYVSLQSIRVKALSRFYALALHNCQTKDLSVENMENLGNITCDDCTIENLTIKQCPELTGIACSENKIQTLIIDDSPNLYSLHAESNKLMWLDMSKVERVEGDVTNWFVVDNQQPNVQAVKISPTEVGLKVHPRFDVSRVMNLEVKGQAMTPHEVTVDGIRYFVIYNNAPLVASLVGASGCGYIYETKWPYPCLDSNTPDNNLPVTLNIYSWTKHPASLSLSTYSISAMVGEPLVAPVVTRSQDYDGQLSYSSSNKQVVTVDQNGQLTPVGVGRAVITITGTATDYRLAPPAVSYTVEITVPTGVESPSEFSVSSSSPVRYNLQGQRVNHPQKGQVYIEQGKKRIKN